MPSFAPQPHSPLTNLFGSAACKRDEQGLVSGETLERKECSVWIPRLSWLTGGDSDVPSPSGSSVPGRNDGRSIQCFNTLIRHSFGAIRCRGIVQRSGETAKRSARQTPSVGRNGLRRHALRFALLLMALSGNPIANKNRGLFTARKPPSTPLRH
jgi:hypothetical protein